MTEKTKITLSEEMETLLIPLYSKAVGSRLPRPIFVDTKAQQIVDQVSYDFGKLKTPTKTVVMMGLRAKKLDDVTRAFLERHPQGMVLHLGCGLDSRCLRVDRRQADWTDLDMPQVIDLRRQYITNIYFRSFCPASSSRIISAMRSARASGLRAPLIQRR